jgi:hypothetical protein
VGDDRFHRGTEEMSATSWALTVITVAGLVGLWGWAVINVPALHDIGIVYCIMAFVASSLGGLAFVSNGAFPFGVYGYPPLNKLFLPLITGATFGYLFALFSGGVAYFSVTLDVMTPFYGLAPLAIFLFYVIGVPGAEEIMFRASVLPMMLKIATHTDSTWKFWLGLIVAVIVNAVTFSITHYYTFGGSTNFLILSAIFGVLHVPDKIL